jgi:hypothetical protein
MTWMLTATGAAVDLQRMDLDSISLLDVAHHLAKKDRFAGACNRLYSVAEHSLLVVELIEHEFPLASPSTLLAALMHDAHEAYTGDLTRPMKQLLGDAWNVVEHRIQMRVLERFKLRSAFAAARREIKWGDDTALASERAALLPDTGPEWHVMTTHKPARWIDFETRGAFTWQDWRQAFLDKYGELEFQQAERSREIAGDPITHHD